MSLQQDDFERVVRERYVGPLEMFSELRRLDISPSEMAEKYILGGMEQLSKAVLKEARRNYSSRMIANSLKKTREVLMERTRCGESSAAGAERALGLKEEKRASALKMDPLGGFPDDYREWLKESLVRHLGSMVECDKEVISSLAEQMNQFLSISRATSIEETERMKRISDVLLEDNVIVRSENKGLYEAGRLNNAEMISFPATLLKLRESVLSLSGVQDSKGGGLAGFEDGLGYLGRGLMMSREQERAIYFGMDSDDAFDERRYEALLREDSRSELRSAVKELNGFLGSETWSARVGWKGRMAQSSRLAGKFSSLLDLLSREHQNVQQVNTILDLCLRLALRLINFSFLLEILQELARLRRQVGDQLILEVDPLVWSRLQIMSLASSFDVMVYDEQKGGIRRISNSWRDKEDITGKPLSRQVVLDNIPLFGCNVVQFHLISDSRVFNEVIQEDMVRARIEISLETLLGGRGEEEGQGEEGQERRRKVLEMLRSKDKHTPTLRKFDTSFGGGRETRPRGSVFVLELCDNKINVYSVLKEYELKGKEVEKSEQLCTIQLNRSLMGDYLVELVTHVELSLSGSVQSCLSVLVNGEIAYTFCFGEEVSCSFLAQVTMIDEIYLELQPCENLTRRLVDGILLRSDAIDCVSAEMASRLGRVCGEDSQRWNGLEAGSKVKVSVGSLLIFLSSIWRGRISRDPRAIFELHPNHHYNLEEFRESDDLSRVLQILNDELSVIERFDKQRGGREELESDTYLVLNLVFILKQFVSGDDSLVQRVPAVDCPGSLLEGEALGSCKVSPNVGKCFQVICRLMSLDLSPELEGFQWVCRITAINALSGMSIDAVKAVFHSISLEEVLGFIQGIMNSKKSEINEIVELIKCLDESDIFGLIITRLLKSRKGGSGQTADLRDSDLNSSFFTIFRELLKRNTEFSREEEAGPSARRSGSLSGEKSLLIPEESPLSQAMADWIKIQIESEKSRCSSLDWMYRYYDSYKNVTSRRPLTMNAPVYRNNCDNRIILNILTNIFVMNGIKISQRNILELITYRFEKEILQIRSKIQNSQNKKMVERIYGKANRELLHENFLMSGGLPPDSSLPVLTNKTQEKRRRLSSSMKADATLQSKVFSENNEPSAKERVNLNIWQGGDVGEEEAPAEVLKEFKPSRDHMKNEKNIVFWREVIYQIVDILTKHSQEWFETHGMGHLHQERRVIRHFRLEDSGQSNGALTVPGSGPAGGGGSNGNPPCPSDLSPDEMVKSLVSSIYKNGSGIYTSEETIWFGHLLKYGITEALGNLVSYSLHCSDLLMSSLDRSEESLSSFQQVNPNALCRIKRQLRYLLFENVVSLNLRVLRGMVCFNENFSEFSRGLFDYDLVIMREGAATGQHSIHPLAESHITFNWLLSQLFVWASIDMPVTLGDYLLSSVKESSLIKLSTSVHPVILRNVVENLFKYRSFDSFDLKLASLANSKSDWVDNLLGILSDQGRRPSEEDGGGGGKTLIMKIIESDVESIQSLGNYWKTFHPKYKSLQLAVYSVIMHLFGVDEVSSFDGNKVAVLEMSLNISRKCCSQLLSNWQAQSSSNGPENIDLQQQTRIKEKFIETTIARCKWVIENVPFNLCNRYKNPTLSQREDAQGVDLVCSGPGQGAIGTADSNRGGATTRGKKNRRATDTNIISNSNSHHIDMLKQLLSIRRRSSQQNVEYPPMITSMGSFGVPSSSGTASLSLKFNRNNSDPSVLSICGERSLAGANSLQDQELDSEEEVMGGAEITSSQVLDIYIHFIMDGPANIQDMNKVIKAEIFSSFLKQMTLEQICKITSCHNHYRISLQPFLRYEGWLYIRLTQLVMIHEFKFRSLLELCLGRDRESLPLPEKWPETLASVADLEKRLFSRDFFKYAGGIVSNIQEWITRIFSCKALKMEQLHQSITENDELWFDSSLRLVILYFMIVSRNSSDEISLLKNITACIFPFIQDKPRDHEAPAPPIRGPNAFGVQLAIADSITGFLIAQVNPEDEKSLIRVLMEHGYSLEQVIKKSNGDENDVPILLFVQRLYSMSLYSVPIFSDKQKFGSFYKLCYNDRSNLFVFRPEKVTGTGVQSSRQNKDAQFYYHLEIKARGYLSEKVAFAGQSNSAPFHWESLMFESYIPIQTCSECLEEYKGQDGPCTMHHTIESYDGLNREKRCSCAVIELYSVKLRIDELPLYNSCEYEGNMARSSGGNAGGFHRWSLGDRGSGLREEYGQSSRVSNLSQPAPPSLSFSSSSSVILLESLDRMNSAIVSNSYIIRLKKRGWILFKTYLLTTLISGGSDKATKERIISYTFGVLTAVSEKIQSIRTMEGGVSSSSSGPLMTEEAKDHENQNDDRNDELSEELGLYVEDILNILIYSVQLTCYSTRLRRAEAEDAQRATSYLSRSDHGSGGWGDIAYSILIRFLRLHDGEKHILKDLWTRNSNIESKISVLLTECIRQCTLKDITSGTGQKENSSSGANSGSGGLVGGAGSAGVIDFQETQEWFLQLNEITQTSSGTPANLRNFSVTLPDLHLFPRSFLKCISSELINYNPVTQEAGSKSKGTPMHQNPTSGSGPESGSVNTGSGPGENGRDLHPIGGNGGGNEVPSSFRNHPHSSIFIGALQSDNFNVNIDGRIVQCTRASMGGGIVICRAPLTFRGLQSTGLSVPPNILSFRVLGIGRFGITVAPSNVLTMSLEEVFQRNDVVGLKPHPPPSSSSSPSSQANSQVYQMPENMFALEIPYSEGTVIDIRYGVSSNSSGSTLRSEIFIGGESIGSVLEVQFNELAQISEDTRLSVIFVILDPITILYEGLPFSTRYRRRSSTWFESIHGGRIVTQEQIQQLAAGGSSSASPSIHDLSLKNLDLSSKKQLLNMSFLVYIQNIKLFQEILVSSHGLLSGLKDSLVRSIHKTLLLTSLDFEAHLESFFSVNISEEGFDSLELSPPGETEAEAPDAASQLLSLLVEKTLLLCSICTIFGIDLNPLEDQEGERSSAPLSPSPGYRGGGCSSSHFERELLLRRRCSNITYGDLPWLSSSIDSGVLCYTSLFGLKLSHLELILEGFYQLFKVRFIHQLYFLLGTENLKITVPESREGSGEILELQKHLLDSLSVLVSRSLLVVSLISRVVLEFSPGNGGPQLSERMKDVLFGFFSLIGNFSLYSCGETARGLGPSGESNLFDIFSRGSGTASRVEEEEAACSFKPIDTSDKKSLFNIITSTGVDCERIIPTGTEQGQARTKGPSGLSVSENKLYNLPEIRMRTILPTRDCNTLWRWISRQRFIVGMGCGSWSPDRPVGVRPIRHLDNSIYGKLSANQKIFNLEGSNPLTAKKLVLKSNGTMATWSIKISAIDTLCNICGIIPDHINRLMFQDERHGGDEAAGRRGIPEKEVISERFFQVIRIMRICTYFIIRGREDFVFPAAHQNMDDNNHLSPSPDYWLMFKRSIYNDIHNSSEISIKESTRRIFDKIDSESVLTDKLYSWQRLIYITACYLDNDQDQYRDLCRNPSSPCGVFSETERVQIQEIITNFLKTEVAFHLVGSLIQIFSIRMKDYSLGGSSSSSPSSRSNEKQLKYSSLSPSVYVAHWLMDQFIRHPLCPSFIRSSIVNRLTWNFLFSLLTNGVHIPTKLAIDSCRMTYWIINNNGTRLSGTARDAAAADRGSVCSEEMASQVQGILDSICYSVSCILSLYECKVSFDGENPLANVNNLPVFRELVLGKVPITQLGWDYFTSAEDYKPINRQKINTTLVCHFMACSARCILDSSDRYTLIPLPHILPFFSKYLSFISISNHLMLSTSDTWAVSDHEISKIRGEGGGEAAGGPLDCVTYDEIFNNEVKPNTLFPWRYIQSALNYISSKNMLLRLRENPVCQEYRSVLRINFGYTSDSDLLERSKRKTQTQAGSPHQNYLSYQLNKLQKRNTGFIGFKLKPVKLKFDHLRNGKVPRILYSVSGYGVNNLIYEYGGYEMGQPGLVFKEVVKHSYERGGGGELLAEERSGIDSHKFRLLSGDEAETASHCLRCSRPLYVNGLHSSSATLLFRLSKASGSLGADGSSHPIRMILVGGLVFDRQPGEQEVSRFYPIWIQNELLQKLRPRRRDSSTRSGLPPAECDGYLGSIFYSYYDDRCLTFGGEEIPNSLTRIRASPDFSVQARTCESTVEISMLLQNRLFTLEVNGTPVANTGLPPQARFLLPVVYVESSGSGGGLSGDPLPPKMYCDIQLKDCLSDVFIPHIQVVSKINYLPVLSSKESLSLEDCQGKKDSVKWVPAELKHRFRVCDPRTGAGPAALAPDGDKAKSDSSDANSLTTLWIQPRARKGDGRPDSTSSESSTPPRLDSRSRNGMCLSVLGYLHPSIPGGISLCSSSNTNRDIYSPSVFNNWKNWILPENSAWTVRRSRRSEDDVLQTQNGNDDECYSNDSGEINIKSRLFKFLDPCKSFSATFRIRQPEDESGGGALSQPFGLGIDWLDGMYRFVWLSDGRFLVPSLPPLPFEISKLYKEYKIPANHQIVIQNLSQPHEFLDPTLEKVSVPEFGLNDKITLEFQPSIPALIFFKNGQYSFSFNFTQFYQRICGSLSLCLDESAAPATGRSGLEQAVCPAEESLSEKRVWVVRTLFVMAILQNDVLILSRLVSKYVKYLIDLKAGEFLFKLLITEDLYNNILNCIPKCISSSRFTIRSLLSNIYNYLMFPDPREFYSERDQTFNWDLLEAFFSLSSEAELGSSPEPSSSAPSHRVFSEKRTQKVIKHETPFWLACWIGNEQAVQYLLKFVHVDNRALNLLNSNYQQQLSLYVGCFGIVSEARDDLLWSSSSLGGPRTKYLIQTENRRLRVQEEKPGGGGPASSREWRGESLLQTGLMASIISGNARIAYILMALYDSDVNIQDMQGNTSYHFAVAFGHLDIVQLLSFKGVNPYIMNNSDQFAGSHYRTVLKGLIERDKSHRGSGASDYATDAVAGSADHQGSSPLSSPVSGDRKFEWEITPSPPNICFHGERERIAEFTQQYEKLYCFSVYGGESITAAKNAQKQPFINLNAQNKSNLLPPYFYPWPGLFSGCQIVAVLDEDSPPLEEAAAAAAAPAACCISIESLEIGGVLHGREEAAEESPGPDLQLERESSSQECRQVDEIFDQRRVNIHIIQHLFYRWIRSIRCHPEGQGSVSGCLSPSSIVSMSISRRPETGRPTDDILYNVNSASYYHHAQMAAATHGGGGGVPGSHFGFDPLGILPSLITSSSSSSSSSSASQPGVAGGGALGTHSGYRLGQQRGGPTITSGELQGVVGQEQQAPGRLGILRSPGRGALLEVTASAADKVVITHEVMEEIYSGLSQVRDVKEILDIIHVMYKYISQVLTMRCSMGGGAGVQVDAGSVGVVFPKNAGISHPEQRESAEGGQSSGSDEKLLQERMIKCCWELLEMEKSIDRSHGYYPYWAVEHERLVWIHNVRRLLSLVSSDRESSLDYVTCNSWIEWIPNLEIFDKSLYSKYKRALASEERSLDSSRTGGRLRQQSLDFQLLVRPVISLDMIVLCKMHQHCQTSIDQKLVQLLNIELNEQQIYRVVLFELLRQINFADKPEFEQGEEPAGSAIDQDEFRSKSMFLLGIKTLDITKMIPKHDSSIWSRTKLSHSDCLDMIRFISNAIKNLFAIVLFKYFLDGSDQTLLTAKPKTVPHVAEGESHQDLERGGLVDLNSLYYSEEEFPFRVIDTLLSKVMPIYTTSLDVFTKIQLNGAAGSKSMIKLKLQSMFWYVDIMKQFLSGRILLLNKFNDISKCTIPMISGVFNSPTLSYEQEDFLRIPSSFYFYNNYFGDLFWKVNKRRFLLRSGDSCDAEDAGGDTRVRIPPLLEEGQGSLPDFVLETPLLLLQSSRLLGSWGSYYNIYSSPRYLIHVGPYDIPIPISSYLLLKPYYKLNLVNSLWNDILKKLIDSKKRDANGNTTANNGLTVHLNRNLAVTGGNPLRYSLLSQSTRQILQMLPEKLRITERPFLVVFRGEGSTDFGGPFQEFLSWISNEIMSKNSDNIDKTVKEGSGWSPKRGGAETAPGDGGHLSGDSQYYGLFTPCANALHSIGHNQDTVSINSVYSDYRTAGSLYVCEEFLLFGSGETEECRGAAALSEESLLSKFKREYYGRRSRVFDGLPDLDATQDHDFVGSKLQTGAGAALVETRFKIFRSVVSKIPSLRCHHNSCFSGNSKILTHTIESKVVPPLAPPPPSLVRTREKVEEDGDRPTGGGSGREREEEDSEMPALRWTESEHFSEGGAAAAVVAYLSSSSSSEFESRVLQTQGMLIREEGVVRSRADSRLLGSSSSSSSSSSPTSLGSIPEELNNAESVNNTNPTPINTQQESEQQSNDMVEDLGIMHRLDPWEWPKDKEMREIIGEMYECLGRLMGICVTTKSAMNINLNPLIWKKFSGLPLSLKDLADADCIAYEMLNSLKSIENENLNRKQRMASTCSPRCALGSQEEGPPSGEETSIPEIEGLTFQIENMNGSITSLLSTDGGGGGGVVDADSTAVGVTLGNLHLFVQLAERCRMLDDANIMTNILKGFGTIIPLGRMRMLFSYQKIEYLICGESKIDLTVLRNHTVSPHPELKEQLFQVLENFNNEQLQKLLRFVSGRSRLPQVNNNSSDWKFSINYDNPDTIQDNRLPIATTCGFRLSLPRYSSIEILRSRLLYAINNCVAIDLDAYVTHDR